MKPRIRLFIICAALLAALCGCGTSADNPPALPDASAEDESSVSKAEKPPRLVIWSQWNEGDAQAVVLREAVDDFLATSPNAAGLTVDINWAGGALSDMLGPAIEEGKQIDVFECDTWQAYQKWRKFLLPLDEYYQRAWPSTEGKIYGESVLPALQSYSRSLADDDMIYTVGYQPYIVSILYNKSHFLEAGIKAPPTTWVEFTAACAALKSAGFTPVTAEDSSAAAWFGLHLARLKGPGFVTELINDSTGMVWDDDSVAAAAGYIGKIVNDGYFSGNAGKNAAPEGQLEFASGEASMFLGGSWMLGEIHRKAGAGVPIGCFNYPALESGVNDTTAGDYGSRAFCINKDCQNPELAFELLAFLTTGKWDAELSSRTTGIPSGQANAVPEQLAEAKALFETMKTPFPRFGGITANTEHYETLLANLRRMLGGEITAEAFIQNSR